MNKQVNTSQHFYWLDLLRFIAAFVVFAGHYRGAFFVEYSLLPEKNHNIFVQLFYFLTRIGHEAVIVFFVLSGFFVFGMGVKRCLLGKYDGYNYVVDRTVRIALPLVASLLFLVVKNIICGFSTNWWVIFGNLFSLQGILCEPAVGPFWSLSYEVWFYVIFGVMANLIVRKNNRLTKDILMVLLLISFLCFTKLSVHFLLIWVFGGMAYLTIPKKGSEIMLWGSLFVFIILIVFSQVTSGSRAFDYGFDISREVLDMLIGAVCCVFVQQLTLFPPMTKWGLVINTVGTKMAVFSYTLYLSHMILVDLLEKVGFEKSAEIGISSVFMYIVELAIGLVVSYLLYLMFEMHTSKVKSFLKK